MHGLTPCPPPEAVIIAAITFSGYLAVYCYEFAFCLSKGIPPMLIDVSLVDVLRSMLIAVPVVLFLAFILTLANRIGANYLAAYVTAFVIVLALFFISSEFSQIAFFILLVLKEA